MKIYIASSWRNQHAVEMLTKMLRDAQHEVLSFVENETTHDEIIAENLGSAVEQFNFDTHSATSADIVIYIGPSGCDAWAEVGAAWAKAVPIFGLWSKGETVGLMRQMVYLWCENIRELLNAIPQGGTAAELDHLELIRRSKREAATVPCGERECLNPSI